MLLLRTREACREYEYDAPLGKRLALTPSRPDVVDDRRPRRTLMHWFLLPPARGGRRHSATVGRTERLGSCAVCVSIAHEKLCLRLW